MRQMVSMFLIVLVVANLIANLPGAASRVSRAVFMNHRHDDMTPEAINLDLDVPNVAKEITLMVANETPPSLCAGDTHITSGLQSNQVPDIGIGDKAAIAIDYGLMIPDDPPRYKLDLPNYDQLRVVLWASGSAFQTPDSDAPGHVCTKDTPVHEVKQDSC